MCHHLGATFYFDITLNLQRGHKTSKRTSFTQIHQTSAFCPICCLILSLSLTPFQSLSLKAHTHTHVTFSKLRLLDTAYLPAPKHFSALFLKNKDILFHNHNQNQKSKSEKGTRSIFQFHVLLAISPGPELNSGSLSCHISLESPSLSLRLDLD